MGVVFNFTKQMNFYDAFGVVSVLVAVMSVYLLVAIKDPDI